ncbi:MAG: hypothetical protein ACKVXR_04535 [Planctomycetota bacterium]
MPFVLGLALAFATGSQTPQPPPTPAQLEIEVLENVRNQPLGEGTVADLHLPEEFLRRVADRIVRSSFEERYRLVVKDADEPALEPDGIRAQPAWIALIAAAVALMAVAWAWIARRKGLGAA